MPNVRPGIFGPDHSFVQPKPHDLTGQYPVTLTPPNAIITFTGYAPVIGKGLVPANGTITVTGKVSVLGIGLLPAKATIAITGSAPTLTIVAPSGHGGQFYFPESLYRRIQIPELIPDPEPVLVTPSAAAFSLKTFVPTVWVTDTITAYAPRIEITRFVTSDEIFLLWAHGALTEEEANELINATRKNRWTGYQRRAVSYALALKENDDG